MLDGSCNVCGDTVKNIIEVFNVIHTVRKGGRWCGNK